MLTVVMATHNGADTLPHVLDAYCRLQPPSGSWRLVIVDNASVDSTGTIVRSFRDKLPLVLLSEPCRGQNRARNRALGVIAGDLIVFSDDDAIPDPAWLVELRRVADSRPDFAMFGGTIKPRWNGSPSESVLKGIPLSVCFAVTDPAWAEGPISSDHVFSPNMAIRAAVFAEGQRFDESIGPQAGDYAMGSETMLTRRLTWLGLRAWHCPSAVVEHVIPEAHVQPQWLLGRARRYGRGVYRWSATSEGGGPRITRSRALRFVVKSATMRALLFARAAWCRRDPVEAFRHRWFLYMLLGYAMEAGLVPWEAPRPGDGNLHA